MAEGKTVSIRSSLIVNLLILIILSSAAIFTAYHYGVRKAVRTLSKSIIYQATDHIESQLDGFFNPLAHNLLQATEWAAAGFLELDDVPALNRLFMPVIAHQPQISSIHVAEAEGREYMLLRSREGWLNRETDPDKWDTRARITTWNGQRPASVVWEDKGYDARMRPWHQGAVRKSLSFEALAGEDPILGIYWTRHYTFFTTKDPGITASVAFTRSDGSLWIVAYDITLNDISRFTMDLQVTENGQVVVLSDDQFRVIGVPLISRFDEADERRQALLKTPEELGITLWTDAIQAYRQTESARERTFTFTSQGQQWWAGVRPFSLALDRALYITVVVPNSDLLGQLQKLRFWIIAIILVTVALTVWRMFALTRRYSAPVEALVAESRRIRRGDLSPGKSIDTRVKEFNRLARALEEMRQGLQELLKLERDLQVARRIQQDTFPRRLPDLAGYQVAAWSEPAEAAGGDTYDVVGLEPDPDTGCLRLTDRQAGQAIFLLADATGHGIGPALSVTQVRAMLRMALRTGDEIPGIVRNMNAQLSDDLQEGRFITAWFGKLNVQTHELISFSAGQAPFFYFDGEQKTCRVYNADKPPFGLLENMDITLPAPIRLNPGDLFVVLSDGLIEPHDADNHMFGKERVIDLITARLDQTPAEILAALREAIEEFTAGAPPDDDRTAVIIKRKPK